jgi:hypothetical protein
VNNLLLTAQPVKIEFLRENIEKSRGFGSEKTKLDARSEAIRIEFCFFTAKTRLIEIFRVRMRFLQGGVAITMLLHRGRLFHWSRIWEKHCIGFDGALLALFLSNHQFAG